MIIINFELRCIYNMLFLLPFLIVSLSEIAKSHNVSYEPDATILAEEEPAGEAICNVPLIELDDAKPPEPGFVTGLPPSDKSMYPGIQYPQPDLPKPFNYPVPSVSNYLFLYGYKMLSFLCLKICY